MKDVHELEIYACIDGYPDYLVTSHGRVLSLKGKKIKEMKQYSDKGYIKIYLYNNGENKMFLVHRLVAQVFIPNHDSKPHINHIDENRQNNDLKNLEWVTSKENNNYGTHNKKVSKSLSRKVMALSLNEQKVLIFKSGISAEKYGFSCGHISKCCNGKRKTHKGYTWKYIDGDMFENTEKDNVEV